jgi:hypothetical protein
VADPELERQIRAFTLDLQNEDEQIKFQMEMNQDPQNKL